MYKRDFLLLFQNFAQKDQFSTILKWLNIGFAKHILAFSETRGTKINELYQFSENVIELRIIIKTLKLDNSPQISAYRTDVFSSGEEL